MNESFPKPLKCPDCGEVPPVYLVDFISGKPIVGCMNICCFNMVQFSGKTLGEALGKWDAWVINQKQKEGGDEIYDSGIF